MKFITDRGKVMFSQASVCPRGGGGRYLVGGGGGGVGDVFSDPPPIRQYSQCAVGTHPTGMHSCSIKICQQSPKN